MSAIATENFSSHFTKMHLGKKKEFIITRIEEIQGRFTP